MKISIKIKPIEVLLITTILTLFSCTKQNDWLDSKTNNFDVVPSKLKDFQGLVGNTLVMNKNYPSVGITSSDNYYVSDQTWESMPLAQDRNAYIWASEIYQGETSDNWRKPYEVISTANIALEGIQKIERTPSNAAEWDEAYGGALFFRAFGHYIVAQLFCKPFDPSTASEDKGIILKLASDPNILTPRSTVKETYDQIINDLKSASQLLPNTVTYRTSPSKLAALAMLARIYLNIGQFQEAAENANKALDIDNSIIDFKSISPTNPRPFPTFQNYNKEVIFYAAAQVTVHTSNTALMVDSNLAKSYTPGDLRKGIFYTTSNNVTLFKGHYTGLPSTFFYGIAINELYLIIAEANARLNKVDMAMEALNILLEKRWDASFTSMVAQDQLDAIKIILNERKKELPFTGNLRWEDLRRLNKNPETAVVIKRVVNGITYSLPPNDDRYVLPIPPDEIRLNNVEQNPR